MLVVHCIKLAALNDIKEIVRFRNKYAIVLQKVVDPNDNLSECLHVSKHIGSSYHRRLAMFFLYGFCCFNVKKTLDRFNTLCICNFGNVCRFNPQDSYMFPFKAAQESAVAGTDIYH